MSNCHLVAARSLIDLAASRLALRAPALRAATALTRPSRSAQRLPCGRQNAPTAKTVGPNNVVANHCVEHGDHLTHHRHDHDLRQLAAGRETVVERLEHRIPIAGAHRRHVKQICRENKRINHFKCCRSLSYLVAASTVRPRREPNLTPKNLPNPK